MNSMCQGKSKFMFNLFVPKSIFSPDMPNRVRITSFFQAWQFLGTSQAENEQETLAISALNR